MLIRGYKRTFRDFSTAENKARKRRDCNAWSNHMDDINSDDNRSDEDWKSDNREEDLQQISAILMSFVIGWKLVPKMKQPWILG